MQPKINTILIPLCGCGCGKAVTWNKWDKKWNKFLKGHKKAKIDRNQSGVQPLCACGCGKLVRWSPVRRKWNTFLLHHGPKKDRNQNSKNVQKCACGCGEDTMPGRKFVAGHQRRKKDYFSREGLRPLCECGCGGYAKIGKRFISGHAHVGRAMTDETKSKISIARKGKPHSKKTKELLSKIGKKRKLTPEHKEKLRIANTGRRPSKETKEKRLKTLRENTTHDRKLRWSNAASQRQLKKSEQMGLTKTAYCDAWEDEEYRNDLRKKYCEICGITNMLCLKISSMRLSNHHTNGKFNCAPGDIQTLCTSCHMRLESTSRIRNSAGQFTSKIDDLKSVD